MHRADAFTPLYLTLARARAQHVPAPVTIRTVIRTTKVKHVSRHGSLSIRIPRLIRVRVAYERLDCPAKDESKVHYLLNIPENAFYGSHMGLCRI
jgi:hypothetical protein